MPVVSAGKTSNPIDRNAQSNDRIRRNWQRITQGAITDTLRLDDLTIGLNAAGEIEILPNGVGLAQQGWGVNKGDLLVYEGNNTYTNLGVGANGYVLTADTATASGLMWEPPTGGAAGYVLYTATGNITSGGTLVVTHAADATNERECFAAVTTSMMPSLVAVPMTSDSSLGQVASASSFYSSGSVIEDAYRAFDGVIPVSDTPNEQWTSNNTSTGWLQIELAAAATCVQYTVYPPGHNPTTRSPNTWTFAGSNDGSTWTTLDTESGVTSWTLGTGNTYSFSNSTAYQYYRITITANNGDTYLGIGELQLFSAAVPNVGPVYVGNTILNAGLTDTFTATFTSTTTTTFTNNFPETLNAIVVVGVVVSGNSTFTLTTTGNTGLSTLGNNTLNIPDYQGQITLTTTGNTGNATFGNNTLNIPDYQGQITLTTTGNTGNATFGNNTLNIPDYQGALTLTTTGTSGNATLGNNTLNIPNYTISLLSTGGLAGNTTPLNLYNQAYQQLSSDPGSPIDSETWYNTTAKSMRWTQGGGQNVGAVGLIYANTSNSGAVTNTTAATTFSGVSVTLPANFLTVGKVLRITAEYLFNVANGSNFTAELAIGGVNVGGPAMDSTASGTGNRAFIEMQFVVISTGSNGTMNRSGFYASETGQGATQGTQTFGLLGGTTSAGINTTGTLLINSNVTWTVASTSNSITLVQFIVELLNN